MCMRSNPITYLPGLKRQMDGRTSRYVAEKTGIPAGTISQLLGCHRGSSLAMALRLAKYLHTSVEALAEAPLPVAAPITAEALPAEVSLPAEAPEHSPALPRREHSKNNLPFYG